MLKQKRSVTILLLFVISIFTAVLCYALFFKVKPYSALTNIISAELHKEPNQSNQTILNNTKAGNTTNEPSGVNSQDTCNVTDTISYSYYKQTEPNWEKNNKFGIYIYAENSDFFNKADELVNSNGGKWGYVLIPFNVKDSDESKWGRVFAQLQSKKLIPIIQLWDVNLNDYQKQTQKAAAFLNNFIWPIKYKYVSVYNEPNDPKFWYGKADPENYAQVLNFTIKTFKDENPDFFMLNGAFNASAPSDGVHIDSLEYMQRMNVAVPGIFEKLDGWASHSYPQPNFAGSPYGIGRWSIRAYEEELKFLAQNLGVKKYLPVFITETGWAHAEGTNYNPTYLPEDVISKYIKIAYEEVWLKDDRVRAVMPFTIWYEPPFDHFAWINKDKVPYKHYAVVKDMKKVKGEPPSLVDDTLNICP